MFLYSMKYNYYFKIFIFYFFFSFLSHLSSYIYNKGYNIQNIDFKLIN